MTTMTCCTSQLHDGYTLHVHTHLHNPYVDTKGEGEGQGNVLCKNEEWTQTRDLRAEKCEGGYPSYSPIYFYIAP